jgi:hypothetical protein
MRSRRLPGSASCCDSELALGVSSRDEAVQKATAIGLLGGFGAGRTKSSSGPTTVGPVTTRIAPSITAAAADMPSRVRPAMTVSVKLITKPRMMSLDTTLR